MRDALRADRYLGDDGHLFLGELDRLLARHKLAKDLEQTPSRRFQPREHRLAQCKTKVRKLVAQEDAINEVLAKAIADQDAIRTALGKARYDERVVQEEIDKFQRDLAPPIRPQDVVAQLPREVRTTHAADIEQLNAIMARLAAAKLRGASCGSGGPYRVQGSAANADAFDRVKNRWRSDGSDHLHHVGASFAQGPNRRWRVLRVFTSTVSAPRILA